ncbi:hypothetical protein [Salinibacillus kushneri]|uniref:hypothetical protein n=1 Tax=Salinibacillus kushneri TaxID=237682 RepID=UPI000B892EAE|nr:hypothetical protein [Salinibacillus kushneri]
MQINIGIHIAFSEVTQLIVIHRVHVLKQMLFTWLKLVFKNGIMYIYVKIMGERYSTNEAE